MNTQESRKIEARETRPAGAANEDSAADYIGEAAGGSAKLIANIKSVIYIEAVKL